MEVADAGVEHEGGGVDADLVGVDRASLFGGEGFGVRHVAAGGDFPGVPRPALGGVQVDAVPAVGQEEEHAVVGPFVAQCLQDRRDDRGHAVDVVVRGHRAHHGARFDRHPVGHGLVFVEGPHAHGGGALRPVPFVAVAEEVLHLREGAHVFGVASAQAPGVGGGHGGDVEGVFAEALFEASGEGVGADVGDGAEGGVDVGVAGADLVGDGVADGFHELGVPGGAEADGLGEEGGVGEFAGAVEDFVELVVQGGEGVAVGEDGFGDAVEAGEFLLVRHESEDRLHAFGDGPVRVEVHGSGHVVLSVDVWSPRHYDGRPDKFKGLCGTSRTCKNAYAPKCNTMRQRAAPWQYASSLRFLS